MSKFLALEDDDQISNTADAIDGNAKSAFYQEILHRSTSSALSSNTSSFDPRAALRNVTSL